MYQKIIRTSVLSAFVLSLVLSVSVWPSWGALLAIWLLFPALTLLLCFVLGFIAGMKADDSALIVDPKALEPPQLWLSADTVIEKSEASLGKFKDQPISEWIKVKLPNERIAMMRFENVVDIDRLESAAVPSASWWTIISPGLLYVEDTILEPEKSVKEVLA
jgi:hypothetical protein